METKNNNSADQNEKKLVFYSSYEGTLQELACVVASAALYCHMKKSNCSSVPASLPSIIRKMIQECIQQSVKGELSGWDKIHETLIFSHRKKKNCAIDLVSFMSWQYTGWINREQTAVNLMECDMLSRMEKYRIACIYCLVGDVKKLWPVEVDVDHPMIRYWNYRMSGKHFTFQVDPEYSCTEAYLINRYFDGWSMSSFEYLWEFLTDDEQVENVKKCNESLLEWQLRKLSKSQLERVMKSDAVGHVFNSLVCVCSNEFVVSLWENVKNNMITPDGLTAILESTFLQYDHEGLAYDIWISAPDVLRNHLSLNNLKTLLYSSIKEERLFLDLLLRVDANTREIVWAEKWKDIIVGVSPSYLQQIMDLCISSEDEVASFKKSHLSNYTLIEEYCKRMVLLGHFDKMSKFFQFSSNDPEIIFNLRKNVLESHYLLDSFIRTMYFKDMDPLVTFLRETFPDTTERNEFVRNHFLSEESLTHFRSAMQSDWIDQVKHFVGSILSSDADLNSAKRILLMFKREILISGNFKIDSRSNFSSRNNFINWCLDNDDDGLENFKQGLPVARILYTVFEKCALSLKRSLDQYRYFSAADKPPIPYKFLEPYFLELTWLLEWFFPTKKTVDFKSDMLLLYLSAEQMRSIFEMGDEIFIDELLCWFFNDDRSRIETFKDSFCRFGVRK